MYIHINMTNLQKAKIWLLGDINILKSKKFKFLSEVKSQIFLTLNLNSGIHLQWHPSAVKLLS